MHPAARCRRHTHQMIMMSATAGHLAGQQATTPPPFAAAAATSGIKRPALAAPPRATAARARKRPCREWPPPPVTTPPPAAPPVRFTCTEGHAGAPLMAATPAAAAGRKRFDPNCPRGKSYTKLQFNLEGAEPGPAHLDACEQCAVKCFETSKNATRQLWPTSAATTAAICDSTSAAVADGRQKAEIRCDPACPDGKRYTKQQFLLQCGGTDEWDACGPHVGAASGSTSGTTPVARWGTPPPFPLRLLHESPRATRAAPNRACARSAPPPPCSFIDFSAMLARRVDDYLAGVAVHPALRHQQLCNADRRNDRGTLFVINQILATKTGPVRCHTHTHTAQTAKPE